jgi:hypothetical protein
MRTPIAIVGTAIRTHRSRAYHRVIAPHANSRLSFTLRMAELCGARLQVQVPGMHVEIGNRAGSNGWRL